MLKNVGVLDLCKDGLVVFADSELYFIETDGKSTLFTLNVTVKSVVVEVEDMFEITGLISFTLVVVVELDDEDDGSSLSHDENIILKISITGKIIFESFIIMRF